MTSALEAGMSPWAGSLPNGWRTSRLKWVTQLINQKTELTDRPYLGLENVESGTGRWLPSRSEVEPEGLANLFEQRDVLFGKLRPYLAKVYMAEWPGRCTSEMLVLRPHEVLPEFLRFVLLADETIKLVDSSTYGVKMPRAEWDFVGRLVVPVPEKNRQRVIAAFLDRKTTAIDALIAKKERQIGLLGEKRQALITQAVTKGLDAKAPLRKVRAPWFDRVPSHWALTVVKRTAAPEASTFTDGDWIEAPFVTDAGIRLLQTGNIGIGRFKEQGFRYVSESTFRELRCAEVFPGDVLICRLDGPVGRACLAPDLGCRMITSVDNAILRPSREFDAGFLVYVLSSQPYLDWVGALCRVGGGHRFRISRSMLGDFELPAPPVTEQHEIRDFLDRTCQSIDVVMTTVAQHVELLREYRLALVSAAVTGKIEIPAEEAA